LSADSDFNPEQVFATEKTSGEWIYVQENETRDYENPV
jgi:hypothetical protein